jgi:hypothetical protein
VIVLNEFIKDVFFALKMLKILIKFFSPYIFEQFQFWSDSDQVKIL